eukprot:c1992_g1_i1.p1 GENE.c1992_g1_i1~~c1992_g1_i1.p1  ORF type:complete len:1020 (-),score=308.18 c1992_g1_i1:52-3084(-)
MAGRSHTGAVTLELGEQIKYNITVPDIIKLMDSKDVEQVKAKGGADGLAKLVHSDLKHGIRIDDNSEFHARVQHFGRNVIPEPEPTSLLELMWEALHDPTLIILIAAACVSLPVGIFFEDPKTGWIEGTAILVSVVIVVMVASINDYQKDKQFRDLNRKKSDIAIKVLRSGQEQNLSINDLVVGDIVFLETGDSIPCDGILFTNSPLKVNESALTGESDEIAKSVQKNPFLIASTQVVDGRASMLTLAVGPNAMKGRIQDMMARASEEEEETVLQKKLTGIAEMIGKMGFGVATFTVVVLIVGYLIKDKWQQGHPFVKADIVHILNFIITGLTIVVVAVPEGLPLAVTISMAFSVKKMLNDNNLVRHLEACEVMGGATNICSDKTGTLTRNKMTVVRAWVNKEVLRHETSSPLYSKIKASNNELTKLFAECSVFNSTARISFDKAKENGVRQDTGSKTECGLLELAEQLGFKKSDYVPVGFEYTALHVFSSQRKRMSVVIPLNRAGKYRVFVKGASEVVLKLCKDVQVAKGQAPFDFSKVEQEIIQTFADEALRTLCLAYRDIDTQRPEDLQNVDAIEKDLTCIAIVGIEDPVRAEVPPAVDKCRQAGITVRMVTGDNRATAVAIAKQCNIISSTVGQFTVMEGPAFRQAVLEDETKPGELNMTRFKPIAKELRVLARSSPADKYTLVQGLKKLGEIVAVTGDGTNDAPALRLSNVGLSMGIQGTEVAKEASDIILMDDNFNSIVQAVKWGRNVFDSISKFVQFQLTVNIVAILVAVIGAFTIQESPLTAVQMLWVNLIMDTLASLALATEAPTEALLTRPPYSPDRPIVSAHMWRNIAGQAIYQLIVLLTMLFVGHRLFDLGEYGAGKEHATTHFTMVFNTFVMLQVFNEINSRKIHGEVNVFSGFLTNPYFVTIVVGTIFVQFFIVEFGGLALRTTPLTTNQWLLSIGLGAGSLIVGFLLHIIPASVFQVFSKKLGDAPKPTSQSSIARGSYRRNQSQSRYRAFSTPK